MAREERRLRVWLSVLPALCAQASMRAPPHYMESTKTFEVKASELPLTASVRSVRKLRDAQRLARESEKAESAEAAAVADAAAAATAGQRLEKKKKKGYSGDPSQEDRLMQRMQAPLHFLRNPRVVLPPRKPATEALQRQPKVPSPGAFIHVSPQEVIFTDYEAGGVYEIPVQLRNVSACSRRLRVLPPTSRFFSVCLLAYPSDGGFLAPGMHAELSVRFAPDSLADYSDFILVQTEQARETRESGRRESGGRESGRREGGGRRERAACERERERREQTRGSAECEREQHV